MIAQPPSFLAALSSRSLPHPSGPKTPLRKQSCLRNKLLPPSSELRAKYAWRSSRNLRENICRIANLPIGRALGAAPLARVILADLLLGIFLKTEPLSTEFHQNIGLRFWLAADQRIAGRLQSFSLTLKHTILYDLISHCSSIPLSSP